MFKIFATIIVMINGAPVGDPITITGRSTFETLEICKAFEASDDHKAALSQLDQMATARFPKESTHTITTACGKKEGESM